MLEIRLDGIVQEGGSVPERVRDLIVVGAGPAGLTAGLYAARARMDVLAIEAMAPGGELLNTDAIEDYPGFELVSGPELAERMVRHAERFGLKIVIDTVEEIADEGETKLVRTSGGAYRAYAVIVTSGGQPKRLGVPGEAEFRGRGVSYCAVCDGAFFNDRTIAVVGGGDSAFQEALFLTRYGREIYLIHRRDTFRAQPILQERVLAHPKIHLITSAHVREIGGTQRVEYLFFERNGEIHRLFVDGVFIFVGFQPNSNLFREHVEHDEGGYLLTDSTMQTSIPGIFAAGDVRAQLARQVTTAVGDATTAAIAAERYVEGVKSRAAQHPSARRR